MKLSHYSLALFLIFIWSISNAGDPPPVFESAPEPEWMKYAQALPVEQAEAMARAIGMKQQGNAWVYQGVLPENSGLGGYYLFQLVVEDDAGIGRASDHLAHIFYDPSYELMVKDLIVHQWFRDQGVELQPGRTHQYSQSVVSYLAVVSALKKLTKKAGE